MLSIQRLGKTSVEKVAYYTELASPTAYYMEGVEPPGQWYGQLAARQRLLGKQVEHADFIQYAMGYDKKGRPLVSNAGESHQMGHDLVFTAPKSVSVLFGLGDEQTRNTVRQAHETAVKLTLGYIEKYIIGIRVGDRDNREFENTKNALFCIYEHSNSRALDMLLHSHAVLLNVSERYPGRHQCVETQNLYAHKKALGAMYRAELAHQLASQLGVEIEEDDEFFRLKAIPEELCNLFSKRSNIMAEALEKHGFRNANAEMKQVAALSTREKKQHLPREILFKRWATEAKEAGYEHLTLPMGLEPQDKNLVDYKDEILSALISNHSVFERRDIIEVVQQYAQWLGVGAAAGIDYVTELVKAEEIMVVDHPELGKCYTTHTQVALERQFYYRAIAYANAKTHELSPFPEDVSTSAATLSEEQRMAFDVICSNTGNLVQVNGKPGVGKSYLMRAVGETYKAEGYQLQGCTLAGSAADELHKSSSIHSQTIESLLRDLENGRKHFNQKTLLVVDEAGMVGVNKLSELLEYAFDADAKILLVGDKAQLPAISAGNVFARLQEQIKPLELNNIQRNKDERDRRNVELIEQGQIGKVFADLQERGLLTFMEDKISCKFAMVDDWYTKAVVNMPEAIMVASTSYDVADLNLLARAKLKERGHIKAVEIHIDNHLGAKLPLAEGDRVMFRQNSRDLGVKNGTLGKVLSVTKYRANSIGLSVLTDDGKQVDFKLSEYNALEHGYAMTVHKAQGKTVDHAFVWMNERFVSRELTYVEFSRSRYATRAYGGSALVEQEKYWQTLAEQAKAKIKKNEFWEDTSIKPLQTEWEPIWF